MAEVLIKACNATHQDEVKDLQGCYKKGYVVVVKPDGWKWGKEELNKEKFYIIRVKDAKPEDLQYLTQSHEITLGTRYNATSSKLGIGVTSSDKQTAQDECFKKCKLAAQEMSYFGLTINEEDYSIGVEEEQESYTVARRRYKIDIQEIEESLKRGIVEVSKSNLKIIDQRQ